MYYVKFHLQIDVFEPEMWSFELIRWQFLKFSSNCKTNFLILKIFQFLGYQISDEQSDSNFINMS